MKSLTTYINEQYTIAESISLDAFIGKFFKDNFEEVESVPASELSGKNTNGEFNVGDTIYKNSVRGEHVLGGKDEYNIEYEIARIMKVKDSEKSKNLGKSPYHIWCKTDDKKIGWMGDYANNFFNEKQ